MRTMSRNRPLAALAVLTLAVGLLAGCAGTGGSPQEGSQPSAEETIELTSPPGPQLHVSAYKPSGKERVIVKTDKGAFEMVFYPDKAPNTVASFLELVKAKFYDGLRIHRVEPTFVVQAGDPVTKRLSAAEVAGIVQRQKSMTPLEEDPQLGNGSAGWSQKAEFNDIKHDRGVVAMARAGDPDSAGSQFYITLGPAHQLDGQYTVFGRVVSGMSVVDRLRVGDAITSMTIVGGS